LGVRCSYLENAYERRGDVQNVLIEGLADCRGERGHVAFGDGEWEIDRVEPQGFAAWSRYPLAYAYARTYGVATAKPEKRVLDLLERLLRHG
jgi:hypothetical protein